MLTGVDQPLDGAGVLLEHVLQIWHRPMPAILGESAFGIELRDGGRIHGVAVGVDHQPTASRITSGSNRRHLNSPEIDGTRNIRASYQPAYQVKPPKLQHRRLRLILWLSRTAFRITI